MKGLLKVLMSLNSQISVLNENGIRIYDNENPDFYISNISYNVKEDKVFVNFEEEKK